MQFSYPLLKKGHYLAPISKTVEVRGLLVGMTEYPTQIQTGSWHSHENPMISFVLEGGNIENRKTRRIQRQCGSINFYHSFEPHQNIYQLFPSKHFSIEMDASLLATYDFQESCVENALDQNPFSKFLFLKILNEVMINDVCTEESVVSLFLEFVQNDSVLEKDVTPPNWVSVLREILNDNWNRQLSLQELSDETGVHPVTISGNFRKYFSCTFGEYMRKIKIDRALSFIRDSKYSLTQVAYECGFADQSHFTRTFKRQTGLLPGDFRKL